MKIPIIAIIVLGVCALFAAEQTDGNGAETQKSVTTRSVTETTSEDGTKTTTTTVTTTTVTTAPAAEDGGENTDDGDQSSDDGDQSEEYTTSPDEGNYIYVKYNGVVVPYYRGYYWIDGTWVWHGRGCAVSSRRRGSAPSCGPIIPNPRRRNTVQPDRRQSAPPPSGPPQNRQ